MDLSTKFNVIITAFLYNIVCINVDVYVIYLIIVLKYYILYNKI